MKTKDKKYKCDLCDYTTNFPQVLGSHKRVTHGIPGHAPSSLRNQMIKKRKTTPPNQPGIPDPHPCPHCAFIAKWSGGLVKHIGAAHKDLIEIPKPKKENQLVKRTTKAIIEANGQAHHEGQDHTNADGIPDALIALTTGRFIELCRSVAFEHDLPPRMFAAKVAAFLYGSQVR